MFICTKTALSFQTERGILWRMEAQQERAEWNEIQTLVGRLREEAGASHQAPLMDRLLALLRPRVRQLVRGVCTDTDAVEDITQEALLRVWRGLPSYDPTIAPFRAWLSQVTLNCAYNALEQRARQNRHELREADQPIMDAEQESPAGLNQTPPLESELVQRLSERERLERILALARQMLSPDDYLVWLEQTVNNAPYQEVALLLGRSESWVRQTLTRVRLKLAAAILLRPEIVSDAEIEYALRRCQRSEEPLTPGEVELLRETLLTGGARRPPGWRRILQFRHACRKLLRYVLE